MCSINVCGRKFSLCSARPIIFSTASRSAIRATLHGGLAIKEEPSRKAVVSGQHATGRSLVLGPSCCGKFRETRCNDILAQLAKILESVRERDISVMN